MEQTINTTLGLKLPTDPRWVNLAAHSLEKILTDHAFCEQKAATQCISIIQLHPDKTSIVEALAPVVTEEWGHFRQVLAEMKKRGFTLGRQRKDEYVAGLIQREPKGISAHEKLLHKLLICALIEARSCERFRLLSEGLEEQELREFYHKFMVAEAGHYRMFLDLAEEYFGAEKTREGWAWWRKVEAEILASLAPRGDRMH
jgi:tRNA-(ms[2]io[6]A)-hydroxylase